MIAESDMGLSDGALLERKLVDGLGERLKLRRGEVGMTVTREVVCSWGVAESDVPGTKRLPSG